MATIVSFAAVSALSFVIFKLAKIALDRRNSPLADLPGLPRKGLFTTVFDEESLLEQCVKEQGSILRIPSPLGGRSIILCDPKAIAHLHSKDGSTYLRLSFSNTLVRAMAGPSMLSADKDDHRRLRRSMAPAFNNAALHGMLDIFYDSAYKLKGNWDALFESNDEVIIDVQDWMSRLTFDNVGIAGFGHNFKTLDGHKSPVFEAFASFSNVLDSKALLLFIIVGIYVPQVVNVPVKPARLLNQMKKTLSDIASELLDDSRLEKGASETIVDRSIIGLLLKGQSAEGASKLTHEEVIGQGLVLLAGFDTTSVSLSWVLVELARNPEMQDKLREELRQVTAGSPSWEQLMSGLPYLDAIVHETLRLHPAFEAMARTAGEDDTIPLSSPLKLVSGRVVNSIVVPKGTVLLSPFLYINTSEAFWGPDAKRFVPERWLQENPSYPEELAGHRRLYTFSDGPRICLGKTFVLLEFKATLSVLIQNFVFELRDGPDTKIITHKSVLPRPKVAGEPGYALPLRVRQVIN